MNIISNPNFNDLDLTSAEREFCPQWVAKFSGPAEGNAFDVTEEGSGEARKILLSLKLEKSWFRISQFIDPVADATHLRFSIKARIGSSQRGAALNIRVMEVGTAGFQKTFINIDNEFVVPTEVETRVVKVPVKKFNANNRYVLAIQASESLEFSLWDVGVVFLDELGKPLYPEKTPSAYLDSKQSTDQQYDKKQKFFPATKNPYLTPKNTSEISEWTVDCNYRLGLRLDRFLLPASMARYGKKYTRMTFLEKTNSSYNVSLRTPLQLNADHQTRSLNLCIHARADRLTVMNCRIFEEQRLVAELPMYVEGVWNFTTAMFQPDPMLQFDTSKEHYFELNFTHEGQNHIDISLCCLADTENSFNTIELLKDEPAHAPETTEGSEVKKFLKNGSFENWSRGINFDRNIPGQQIADHWYLEFRRNQAEKFDIMPATSAALASNSKGFERPKFSIRVKTNKFEGMVRLSSPVDLDALSVPELQLKVRVSACIQNRAMSIHKVMLLARGNGKERVAHTLLRKQRVRNNTELVSVIHRNDMVKVRKACAGFSSLVLCVEFACDSDVQLTEVCLQQFHDNETSAPKECVADSLICEDPAITSQLESLKGFSEWSSSLVIEPDVYSEVPADMVKSISLLHGGIVEKAANSYRPDSGFPSIDIIVPVYNALKSVVDCINSVIKNTTVPYTLFCIDDASDGQTAQYLESLSDRYPNVIYVRNTENIGYTKSVNCGLRKANAEYVCILNSDCIVTPNWIEQLVDCARSDAKIAMVGPLSNAASYQSVPRIYNDVGDWNFNPLPCSLTLEKMASMVNESSQCEYPSVRVINGFCQFIKRSVIEEIGILDEAAFPRGFGEENDFCARVVGAGYEIRIADDTYVFHTKSQSFGKKQRKELSALGSKALKKKHPTLDWKKITKEIESDAALSALRKKIISSEH